MNVFVTGPDGVLGSNVLRELLLRNYNVTAMVEKGKKSPTIEDLPIRIIAGNLLDKDQITEVTKGMDVIIHCGALTTVYPPRAEIINKVNIEGTQNIINACVKNKVKRLVYIGTANSFGAGTQDNPGNEKNPYYGDKYGLDYIDSKYKAQEVVLNAVRSNTLDAVIVNPTFMIGPYDSKPSSGAMILSVFEEKLPGYTTGGKNFIAVKDAAIGVVNAIEKGRKGECYILGNENLNFNQIFEKISNTIGAKKPKVKLPRTAVVTIGYLNSLFAKAFRYKPTLTYELAVLSNEHHYYSPNKARKELDLPSTPIEVAIKECFEWFIENGYISK